MARVLACHASRRSSTHLFCVGADSDEYAPFALGVAERGSIGLVKSQLIEAVRTTVRQRTARQKNDITD
jgi:hypothetical protein